VDPRETRAVWDTVEITAEYYGYAEDLGIWSGQPFDHNPDSLYIPLGNNSNTFVRWVMNQMSITTAGSFKVAELDGSHPGNAMPQPTTAYPHMQQPWNANRPEDESPMPTWTP
jgi:hypothetical protein